VVARDGRGVREREAVKTTYPDYVAQRSGMQDAVKIVQGWEDAFARHFDPALRRGAVNLRSDRRVHRPTILVPDDNEERRLKMRAGLLQRPLDRGTQHVSHHSGGEKLAESDVEHELRWHPAVAAPQNGGICFLTLGKIDHDLVL
jgi:hypothetical protein